MHLHAIGDEELLEYIIEVDMEDKTARVILQALRLLTVKMGGGVSKKALLELVRGVNPGRFRQDRYLPVLNRIDEQWGRLRQLTDDQVLDFIESLIRQGLIDSECEHYTVVEMNKRGLEALNRKSPIPVSIPWPFPACSFPHKDGD